jgi:hypothetical protein
MTTTLSFDDINMIIHRVIETLDKRAAVASQRHTDDRETACFTKDFDGHGLRMVDMDEPAREQAMLDSVVSRINEASARVELQLDRIYDLGNRLYGAMPEEGSGLGRVMAAEPATMDRVFIALARLDELNAQLSCAVDRIAGIA